MPNINCPIEDAHMAVRVDIYRTRLINRGTVKTISNFHSSFSNSNSVLDSHLQIIQILFLFLFRVSQISILPFFHETLQMLLYQNMTYSHHIPSNTETPLIGYSIYLNRYYYIFTEEKCSGENSRILNRNRGLKSPTKAI